jgi:L-fuconolactonase
MPGRIVDTHIHVWDFEKAEYPWLNGNTSILNRTFQIDELDAEAGEVGITAGLLVQAANNPEDTQNMLEVARKTEWIKGVVGWLPLTNPAETEKVLKENYSKEKYFKGVRHLIHDEADPKWLLKEEVLESLEVLSSYNLPYDVVGVLPQHIETTLLVAERIPSLKLVLDHLNQPPIVTREKFGRWGDMMKEASKLKNIHAKISGLGTTSNKQEWTKADVLPYVEFVLEAFGQGRCFCGGDWPVSLLAGSYSRTWKIYTSVIDSLLKKEQRNNVYYANAVAFYKL